MSPTGHGRHLPGRAGPHAMITPQCRANRGADGAWAEAVSRLRECYDAAVAGWGDRPFNAHIAITIEPSDAPQAQTPKEQ